MAVTLAIADDLWRGLRDHLLAARHERIAFVLARDAGERLLARETLAIPDAALEVRAADRVSLQLDALIDAMNAAADSGLVLVETHSHPRSRGRVEFSPVDLRGQAEMASYLSGIMPGRPYAALVIGRNAVRGRIWRDGRADDLGSISVLGSCLERWPADGLRHRTAASPPPARERHSRQALAFGREGQTRIARTRVAIVGLGGIGSLVAMQLAHLGVRDLVLIDDDLVEESNLNRLAGAGADDAGRAKVEVAADYARRLDPGADITALRTNIRDAEAIRAVSGADVLFGCVDSEAGRLVMNRLALAYMLPYIDCGVGVTAAGGRVSEAGGRVVAWTPGRPCLICCRAIDTAAAGAELEAQELREDRYRQGYVAGADVPEPSVISLNGVIASMAVTEFLALTAWIRASHHYREYDMLEQRAVPRIEQRRAGCVACAAEGAGDEAGLERYARRGLPADLPLPGEDG